MLMSHDKKTLLISLSQSDEIKTFEQLKQWVTSNDPGIDRVFMWSRPSQNNFVQRIAETKGLQLYIEQHTKPVLDDNPTDDRVSDQDIDRALQYHWVKNELMSFLFLGVLSANKAATFKVMKKRWQIASALRRDRLEYVAFVIDDPSGDHWIACVIELKRKSLDYFDSLGNKPHKQARVEIKQVFDLLGIQQGNEHVNTSRVQLESVECGVFAVWYITERIKSSRPLILDMVDRGQGKTNDKWMCAKRALFWDI